MFLLVLFYFFFVLHTAIISVNGELNTNHGTVISATVDVVVATKISSVVSIVGTVDGESTTSLVGTNTTDKTEQQQQDDDNDQFNTTTVGQIRYHYCNYNSNSDDLNTNNDTNTTTSSDNYCTDVVLMGVGTAMSVEDYNKISTVIVERLSQSQSPATGGIVFIVSDHNPGRIVKTSFTQYATLYNEVQHQLHDLIPVCGNNNTTTTRNFYIGGHSASGQAALVAATRQNELNEVPDGFIGWDPYDISDKTILMDEDSNTPNVPFPFPTLDWGFTKTTCFVPIEKAAAGAYRFSSSSSSSSSSSQTTTNNNNDTTTTTDDSRGNYTTNGGGRVLYQIDNDDGTIGNVVNGKLMGHCVFTDTGCGVGPVTVCPTETNQTIRSFLYKSIADSIHIFLSSIRQQKSFTNELFASPAITYNNEQGIIGNGNGNNQILFHVNEDIIIINDNAFAAPAAAAAAADSNRSTNDEVPPNQSQEQEQARPSLPLQQQQDDTVDRPPQTVATITTTIVDDSVVVAFTSSSLSSSSSSSLALLILLFNTIVVAVL